MHLLGCQNFLSILKLIKNPEIFGTLRSISVRNSLLKEEQWTKAGKGVYLPSHSSLRINSTEISLGDLTSWEQKKELPACLTHPDM